MKFFSKRADKGQYRNFSSMIKGIKKINVQDTMQEVDMMAGYWCATICRSEADKEITKKQKDALLEMVATLQDERRAYLENEPGRELREDSQINFALTNVKRA